MGELVGSYGLLALFALVALESLGLPVPGEAALITAGVLASQGVLEIEWVIVVAAAAAIIGDNCGYVLGRKGGRALLERFRLTRRLADRYLPRTEHFFARFGGPAVLLARFVAGLRMVAAWAAGIAKMPWWRFLLWNALGGILWATVVGLAAYVFGNAAVAAFERYGLVAALAVVVLGLLGLVGVHRLGHRAVGRTKP